MSDIKREFLSSRLPFWDRLRENQRDALVAGARTARYKKGSQLADVGEDCGVILVKRGRICAIAVSEEGREVALLCCYSGDMCLLAAHAFMDTAAFNISISAETEADVMIIDTKTFSDVCKSNIHAEGYIRRVISDHFSMVVGNIHHMLIHSPERRIAAYLCSAAERTGSGKVRATHEQIAKHVGTAREVVTRTLKKMAGEGMILSERGFVVIKDKAALKKLV